MKNFGHTPSSFSSSGMLSNKSNKFKIWRFMTILIITLSDMLVSFQRAFPAIVSESMSKAYNVKMSDLSIFSSIFFYPYAFIQPFAGLLADVIDPRYLIGICSIVSSFGSFICGISSNLLLGCIGRFLVGFGCAPIYVPSCRIIANWYPLKQYSRMSGVFAAFACCGGLIAHGPFSRLSVILGWRWCFFIISIQGLILSILVLCFVRGNPITLGYDAVNQETSVDVSSLSMKEKFNQLCNNFFTVVKNKSFWLIGLYNFGINGAYTNINGMWGGPYLRHVYDYSLTKTGYIMMAISAGNIIGALIMPSIAEFFNTRKWFIFYCSCMAFGCLLPFYYFVDRLNSITIVALLFFYALFANSLANVAYPMCREYFHASIAGTALGCLNLTCYLSTIIIQRGTGLLLNNKYKIYVNGNAQYSALGYKNALWLSSMFSTVLGIIGIVSAKDTNGPGNLNCLFCKKSSAISQNYDDSSLCADSELKKGGFKFPLVD